VSSNLTLSANWKGPLLTHLCRSGRICRSVTFLYPAREVPINSGIHDHTGSKVAGVTTKEHVAESVADSVKAFLNRLARPLNAEGFDSALQSVARVAKNIGNAAAEHLVWQPRGADMGERQLRRE
jgi:hypothetical protein